MIKGLKIKNWKSHSDSEFKFDRGTNVLVGVMGSGKSSVLSAISFALFGTFPSHRSREVTLDETIMNRPQKKDKADVQLVFTVDGKEFEIKRTVERGKGTTEAYIRNDGEIIDTGPSRVTEIVEKKLKVDYNLFSRAVYSEQDGLDNFLEIRKGERMKKIDSLLQIDKFEKCRGNATTLINRLGDKIDSGENVLESMETQEDFSRIEKLKEEENETDDLIKTINERLQKTNKQYKRIQKDIEEGKRALEDVKTLENKKSEIKGAINNLEDEIDSLKSKKDLKVEKINKILKKADKALKTLEKRKEDHKKDLDDIKEKEREKKIRIRNLQKGIQKVKGISGQCPTCERELDKTHRKEIIEEKRKRISELGKEKQDLEEKIQNKGEALEKIKNKIKVEEDDKKTAENQKRIVEELKEKKDKAKRKKEKLEVIKKKIKKKKENHDLSDLEGKQDKINNLSGKRERLKERIENKKRTLKEKKVKRKEIENRKKRYEKLRKQIKRSERVVENLKKFRGALKSTQEELRSRFIEDINKTLAKIWNRLYPYQDFTGLRFTVNDGDYELQLKNKQKWKPVDGVASGGERTSSCLALRIAFSLVLAPNLGWLVLDEPTHNLDKRAVGDLSELLRTGITDFADQIFLITHNEIMENAANSYLYNLKRNKRRDNPTKVEEIK